MSCCGLILLQRAAWTLSVKIQKMQWTTNQNEIERQWKTNENEIDRLRKDQRTELENKEKLLRHQELIAVKLTSIDTSRKQARADRTSRISRYVIQS
jgi:hypothetical protein